MRHATDESLLAYLDDELPPDDRARIDGHLAGCARCRETLDEIRDRSDLLSEALLAIDRAAPDGPRPAARPRTRPSAQSGRRGRRARGIWLRAAVVLLALTGVASALPGSPVRDWIVRSVATVAPWIGDPAPEAGPDAPVPDPSGVVARVAGGSVTIRIQGAAPDTRVRVRLAAGTSASVMADRATFRTAPGQIEAELSEGSGTVTIEIPESARSARIHVNGEPFWEKDGDAIRAHRPAESSDGETVFRTDG